MKKPIFIVLLLVLLVGCYSVTTTKLQDFHPDSRRLVLLTPSRWDAVLRLSLAKKGFTLLQFAAQEKVIAEGGPNELASIYQKAKARYGLSLRGQFKDMGGQGGYLTSVVDGSCEVTDIQTDEVVLVIQLNGPISDAFDKLAIALDDNWNNESSAK